MVHIADIVAIADKMKYIESYLNMGNVVAGLS